jgi:argininosuccinate lyase
MSTSSTQTHYEHADMLHALSEAGRVEDLHEDLESNTMKRLRDGQLKLGVARSRQEHCAGNQRRMVN